MRHYGDEVMVTGPGIGFHLYAHGEVDGPDHLEAPEALRKVAFKFLLTGCTECLGSLYDGACHN